MPRQMLEAKLHEAICLACEEIAVREGLELEGGTNMLLETRGGHERRWKRYPAYKDSEVEWVGEVPEHWGLKRLKYISTVNDGTLSETTDSDFELLYVDISSVDPVLGIKNKELMTFENAPSRARRKVCHGDVILSTVRTYLRAISPINDPEPNMIVSTGFAVIRPKDGLESRFAAYALCAPYFVDEVVANSVGVSYPAINANELITFNVALPSLPEQRAIAAFLDHETGRIDALIVKKERQIEILQEKRAALISHAVAKGLDPDAPMKDSGVEWLGEVPEHWEMLALKRLAILKSGESITVESIDKDGDYPVFGGNGLRGYTTTFTHDGNYVLIGRQGALCGNINYAQGKFWASEHAVVVSPIGPVETKWLGELLRTMNLNQYSVSAAQPGLSAEMVSNLSIPHPPLQEQSTIAAFLNRETGHIDSLLNKIRESITKLHEYRTALISAAVTGKIDVREELVS